MSSAVAATILKMEVDATAFGFLLIDTCQGEEDRELWYYLRVIQEFERQLEMLTFYFL